MGYYSDASHCSLSHSRTILDGSSRMPTDYSGAARAAKLRRISASQGPVSAVRPNIGSQALDAQLGRLDCCPVLCNPQVNWETSPIQLTQSQGFVYSAPYATVISDVAVTPVSGEVTGYTPPEAFITVSIENTGNLWVVIFTSDMALTGSLTWGPEFVFACVPPIINGIFLTFTLPV